MININRVGRRDDRIRVCEYYFPTIDFKFQNIGNASAYLWQFVVSVLQAEIDYTPELSFRAEIEDNALQVIATNYGWGTAHECDIQIDQPILNRIFTDSTRQYRGTIESGKSEKILHLTRDLADPNQFETLRSEFSQLEGQLTEFSKLLLLNDPRPAEANQGLLLDSPIGRWKCRDNSGNAYHGEGHVVPTDDAEFFLTPIGFVKLRLLPLRFHNVESDITYITVIDPSMGSHDRRYPISREIPQGDVERFHIMIGASMSCHLSVRFGFFIDKDNVVESNMFDIHIWNPRNSRWDSYYRDGDNVSRRTAGLQYQMEMSRRPIERENLKAIQASYPFLTDVQLRRLVGWIL